MALIASLVWVLVGQGAATPLSGTVVGPGGEPVVGAELILTGLPSYAPPIIARGTSGEGGRFTLTRPAGLAGDHHPERAPILWAAKPGFRLSTTRFPEALPAADEPFRIVLEPPGKAKVKVEDPDGRPVAGAVVLPERLRTPYTNIPDEIAEKMSATTGEEGVAVVDAVPQDELAYVDVRTREHGVQGWTIATPTDAPVVVSLRQASTWKGRLTADAPAHVKGWKVRAWTRVGSSRPDVPLQAVGYVETATDDEGRFALDPIAVGALQIELKPPADLPVVADVPQGLSVNPGADGAGEIPLRKPVVITGRILERGTGKPAPDADVNITSLGSTRNQNLRTKTDAEGRYTLRALPGKLRLHVYTTTPTYVSPPGPTWLDFDVADGAGPIEMATREMLRAAPPLLGEVRDEGGRPVAGASVQAEWRTEIAGAATVGRVAATTDDAGGFRLEGLGPDAAVTITATYQGRKTQPPLATRSDVQAPVKLVVTPMPVLSAVGRLTAPAGKALSAIPVRIDFRPASIPNVSVASAMFGSSAYPGELKTGADGSFETPKEIERKPGEFRISVDSPGFIPAKSDWVPTPDGELLRFPDLALTPLRGRRVVEGRVADRDGKPIAGAAVSPAGGGPNGASSRSDANGRFRLAGVQEGKSLVFAEAEGFRFGGAIVDGNEPVEVVLARKDGPPVTTLRSLSSPLSRAEERTMGREFLQPLLSKSYPQSAGVDANAAMLALARIDPERMLDRIEQRVVRPDAVMGYVILGQFEIAPDAAIATIRDDVSPASRAAGWLVLDRYRPAADLARRADFLEKSLADARQVAPAQRIRLLGLIADRWLERGSLEKARPILLEGRDAIAGLPADRSFFEFEAFAEVLAVVDLPAATAIFERRGRTNVSQPDAAMIDRHKAGAAVRIARFRPEEAEALMPPASLQFHEQPTAVLAVARRMAHADPDRARRLLEAVIGSSQSDALANPALVSFGLGAMADELAEADPARARSLLDDAFAGLRKAAGERPGAWGQNSPSGLMAELLPVVERVEPDRLAERVWMAVASRSPGMRTPMAIDLLEASTTAALVARYDRKVADVIAEPVLELLASAARDAAPNQVLPIARSLTVYDPRVIPRLLQSLPDSARKIQDRGNGWAVASLEDQLRLSAGQILAVPPEARPAEVRASAPWRWSHLTNE